MINTKQTDILVHKLKRLEKIYSGFIVREKIEVECTLFETKDRYLYPPVTNYKPITQGDSWGGEFVYGWFKLDLKDYNIDENTYLYCNTDAVEGLVFVNNKPYGMFDNVDNVQDSVFRVHEYLRLPNDTKEIAIEGYSSHSFNGTDAFDSIHTWSLTVHRPIKKFKGVYLVKFNEDVRSFVTNLHMINGLYRNVDDFKKAYLNEYYEEIFRIIEMLPADKLNLESVRKANAIIEKLYTNEAKDDLCELSIIGHSHLDTAWLWKIDETKRKLVETVSTAVRLINRYPGYKFMMSSMLHFDWLKHDYPELFNEVLRLEKLGKFEINGGTYVECDCNMIGSESLTRQFLRGQRWMMEHTNHYSDCFFLPDTFGYSPAIPQIMKLAKTDYFLTTKLRWNDTNKFPYETFYWEGIDGTKVLTHFNTIQVNPDPEAVIQRLNEIDKKYISNEALVTYGFGDGGGGCDEVMVEYGLKSEKMKFLPKVTQRTVSDFMNKIASSPRSKNYPIYSNELYLELHRATLTNNHKIKYLNRKLEYALHDLELLNIVMDKKYDDKINEVYDNFMQNQFHDILPATCIKEADDQAIEENTHNLEVVQGLIGEALKSNSQNEVSLINPTSFTINYPVLIDGHIALNEVTTQSITIFGKEKTLIKTNLEPYASKSYSKKNAEVDSVSFDTPNTIETNSMKIVFDENKTIIGLYDKIEERELVKTKFNSFLIGENVPNHWDNWDIDADYIFKINEDNRLIQSKVINDGPLAIVIENIFEIGDNSKITQNLVIYKDEVRIDFYTNIDWHEIHKVLKAEFDCEVCTRNIRNEMQFGYVDRSMGNTTLVDQAQFEVCNHKYSSLCENGYTLSLLNDSTYGLSAKESKVGLTLLTSGTHPDPTRSEGENLLTYSLIASSGRFGAKSPISQSYNLNDPILCVEGKFDIDSFVSSQKENVVVETVKSSYDKKDIIVRLYEATQSRITTTINFSSEYDIYETNILEDDEVYITSGNSVKLHFRPFEIKTLKLKRK